MEPAADALALVPECVHCGFCLPACPTYDVLGTEMDSPRGRLHLMRALETGRLQPTEAVVRHLDLCLGCRACETACPSGVPYGQTLERARGRLAGHAIRPLRTRLAERGLHAGLALPPGLQRVGLRLLRAMTRLPGVGTRTPTGPVSASLGLLVAHPPQDGRLPRLTPARGRRRLRVGLLAGCVGRLLFGDVNQATARLLSRVGCDVIVPPGQRCCGALHAHGGDRRGAQALARRNIAAFEQVGRLDAIVVNAAGCGSALKQYGALLADQPRWAARAQAFAQVTRDALELLDQLGLPPVHAVAPRHVAYHDACHLAHAQGVRDAPRRLLAAVPGLTLVPLADADRCCGSAGIYNISQPAVAGRLLDDKLQRLAESGADVVAAANPGCLLHLTAGLARRAHPTASKHGGATAGPALQAMHPLQLLDQACAGMTPG